MEKAKPGFANLLPFFYYIRTRKPTFTSEGEKTNWANLFVVNVERFDRNREMTEVMEASYRSGEENVMERRMEVGIIREGVVEERWRLPCWVVFALVSCMENGIVLQIMNIDIEPFFFIFEGGTLSW